MLDHDLLAVPGGAIGHRVIVFRETTSTNDVAASLGEGGAENGIVVFAERQTAGRGRMGRRWHSQEGGGLCFSVLLRRDLDASASQEFVLSCANEIAAVLARMTNTEIRLKPPNDLYVRDRKLAGLLLEQKAAGFAILGVGINVNQTRFPEEIENVATSLALETGRNWDLNELGHAVLKSLAALPGPAVA